jgi:hypothetical protein
VLQFGKQYSFSLLTLGDWNGSEMGSFDLPRILDEVNEILFDLHDK